MNVSIVIQAGGQSSRMGEDKGLLELCGRPMIENIIQRLKPYAHELIITTNHPERYRQFGIQLVGDIYKDYGALAGLHTALSAATNEVVFVIACDLPFVNLGLYKFMKNLFMAKNVDVVIPKTEMGYEPFYALYRKSTCLPYVSSAIDSGKRRLISWFESAIVHPVFEVELRQFDPLLASFVNINTPEDLKLAEKQCLEFL
ncbi:MAG: molybdenum cofactor guanylyltransferase [Anaerolineaceae bacterium]|nr:molybdenum cofactor guanylyltransferase [Anaerolineaceae bacterium]